MAGYNPAAYHPETPAAGRSIPAPVNQSYCVPYVAQFVIDQKVLTLSGGKFEIHDAQGNLLFQVKGKSPLALHTRRVLRDSYGTPLVLVKKKMMTMHDRWTAYRGEDDKDSSMLFTMAKAAIFEFKPHFNIFLAGNNSDQPDFTVKGDFFAHSYTVNFQGTTVAEIRKKVNIASVFAGKDQYSCTVYPGVDHAFIATVMVIVDQVKQDDQAASES